MRIAHCCWLFCTFALPACSSLHATEPNVRNVSIRGLQIAGTTTLVIDGDDFGTAPRLLLPFAAKQERKPNSTEKQATFDVTLGNDVQPGYHHLRIVTDGGVSLPVVIGVDRMPQKPFAALVELLPVALHGAVAGSGVVETKVAGKAGQKMMVEVEAQRLGSKLRPVVHLYSPKQLQLAWSWATPALGGDTRLEATLPEDGAYTIALHDEEYAPPGPGHFRMKVGQWGFVDQVFPPVIGKGKRAVELSGSALPMRVDVTAAAGAGIMPLDWPKDGLFSGPRPFVTVSARTEMVEDANSAKGQQLPAGLVGVSGKLLTPFEEDRYRVPVQPGSKMRFEVFAERLGSPIDTALVIRNDMLAELARAEDSPGTLDPVLEYTVPANVTSLLVGVVDAQGRGGPRGIYRLAIEPESPNGGTADFRLHTPSQRIGLPVGGRSVVPVLLERHGYQGRVTLSADTLPAGVTLENAVIPAETDGALVTVQRGTSTAPAAITTWRGRADDATLRTVALKGHPMERLQPWLATELAVAPSTAKATEFQVDYRGLAADAGLVPAGRLPLPLKLTRPVMPSLVRLTLITNQLPPIVNNQPDLNATLRQEKPIELADKIADGELTVLVPPLLSAPVYDVTVQAELLSPDRQKVLASAFAPVRSMAVKLQLVVQLESNRLEGKLDPKTGTTFKLKGKVERREGLASDVSVTLTGLPAGGRADAVSVKAGVTELVVNVVLLPTVPTGELKGLKLSASAIPDAKQPNVRVKSRDVDVTLVVK